MRNTARIAGSVLPGNRLPSVCGKDVPLLRNREKTACFTGRSGGVSCMGKGLIPNPVKMGFYCVTYNQNCTYKKTGRGGYSLAAAPRLFSFSYPRSVPFSRSGSLSCRKMLSIFCLITSYSLTCFSASHSLHTEFLSVLGVVHILLAAK